jgi:hypothetical protein
MMVSPVDPDRPPFSVRRFSDELYFTDMDIPGGPAVGFPFRLFTDEQGRRYVVLGERTYLHEDDRPPG